MLNLDSEAKLEQLIERVVRKTIQEFMNMPFEQVKPNQNIGHKLSEQQPFPYGGPYVRYQEGCQST